MSGTAPSPFASGSQISPREVEKAIRQGRVRPSPFAAEREPVDLNAESWVPEERLARGGAWVPVAAVVKSPFVGEPTEEAPRKGRRPIPR